MNIDNNVTLALFPEVLLSGFVGTPDELSPLIKWAVNEYVLYATSPTINDTGSDIDGTCTNIFSPIKRGESGRSRPLSPGEILRSLQEMEL